jgi:hypothetical protein
MQARHIDFWSHITPVLNREDLGECWEWQGNKQNKGYGTLVVRGKRVSAHRYAWTLTNGDIPERMCVLHKCDVRHCINPAHLFLGTFKDNSDDMVSKGRGGPALHKPGELNPQAVLTWEQALAIREEGLEVLEAERLYGIPRYGYLTRIGRRYGVSPGVVKPIIEGKTWREEQRPVAPAPISVLA